MAGFNTRERSEQLLPVQSLPQQVILSGKRNGRNRPKIEKESNDNKGRRENKSTCESKNESKNEDSNDMSNKKEQEAAKGNEMYDKRRREREREREKQGKGNGHNIIIITIN